MDASTDVGQRLQMVRKQAGLSQRALSKRAGVANSMVSQIEAGKINPSVGALKRILDGRADRSGGVFLL